MNVPSHIAYPYILANAIALALGTPLTLAQNVLLILFCVLPDLDIIINWAYTKTTGRRFHAGVNHHEWASHWPISYIPLALLFIIIPNSYTGLMLYGIISHLVLDSIACAWGVMWLYPFSRRWFNYYAAKFRHTVDGLAWLKTWKQTYYFRAELAAITLVGVHLVFLL